MENNLAIVRVPVEPFVKNFLHAKFSEFTIDDRFIDIRKISRHHLGFSIKSFIENGLERYVYVPKNHDKSYVEFILPKQYLTYGLSDEGEKNIRVFLEFYARNEIIIMASVLSFLPGVSRSQSIRTTLEYFNITDEEYDQSHFRRYFDRFGLNYIGKNWATTRKQFTIHLKKFFVDFLDQKHKGKTAILKSIKQYENEIHEESRD